VALLLALVADTRQEFLTDALADRDLVGAFTALLTKEGYNLFATAWAKLHLARNFLTRLAGALMANLLAIVFATVQRFIAHALTDEDLASTLDSAFLLPAEALHLNVDVAFIAGSLMAGGLTCMLPAVQ